MAIRLNNLAVLLKDTNRIGEAEPLMRRALAIEEHSFGSDHPNVVATRLKNLSELISRIGRLSEAEALAGLALDVDEQDLGMQSILLRPRKKQLKVFLCHASQDKTEVKALSNKLRLSGFDPWVDEAQLLPGQAWELEIAQALRKSDAVIVCLSNNSISKTGYVQKEIADALDLLTRQPEGSIFLIPLQLEECEIPRRLAHLQAARLFDADGYLKLVRSLSKIVQS